MLVRPAPSHRSATFLLTCALAYAGAVIGYLPLLVFFLPIKVEGLAGDGRLGVLTATVIAGVATSSVSNILFGWLSDRAVARGGERRPWLTGGAVGLALAYLALSRAGTPLAVVLAIVAFQVAVNAILAPLLALIAEEVPDAQKGTAGGLLALANPLASALASLLLVIPALNESTRLLAIPVIVGACCAPLLLGRSQPCASFAIAEPAPRRDLLVAWAARLLVQVAGNGLSLYLLYYFESIVPGTPRPLLAGEVGRLLTVAYLLPLPIAVLAGRWSDRTRRRKPFLLGAATLAAGGLVVMAAANSWTAGAAGFTAYALGQSVFLALHAGFAMQLLPSPAHRGRDLGVLNLANTLPALGGPMLTWWLATPRDFHAVLLSLAALMLAGGVTILGARGRA